MILLIMTLTLISFLYGIIEVEKKAFVVGLFLLLWIAFSAITPFQYNKPKKAKIAVANNTQFVIIDGEMENYNKFTGKFIPENCDLYISKPKTFWVLGINWYIGDMGAYKFTIKERK